MKSGIRYALSLKLILVGDPSVGKTSLLGRIIDNSYKSNPPTTLGVDFSFRPIEIEGSKVKLQLWDTAGQEKYRSLINSYYKHSDGIIMVFDLSDMNSFENLVQNWLLKVVSHTGNIPPKLLILGNKKDLKEQRSDFEEVISVRAKLEGIHNIVLRDLDKNPMKQYKDRVEDLTYNLNGSKRG